MIGYIMAMLVAFGFSKPERPQDYRFRGAQIEHRELQTWI